jgi:16S rRNA (adenine1518-N6/adenine1519-N6)-dimethyltransferase
VRPTRRHCEDDAYGALSLLVQKDWNVELLRVVPPEVFDPKPRVDSAVIRLTPRDPATLPVFDHVLFDRWCAWASPSGASSSKICCPKLPAAGKR